MIWISPVLVETLANGMQTPIWDAPANSPLTGLLPDIGVDARRDPYHPA
jgi:hypothetical protein